MPSAIYAALSALDAFATAQAVTANNVANAATEEFDPSRVVYEDRADLGGVAVSDIQETEVQAPLVETLRPEVLVDGTVVVDEEYVEASGTDLATEMVQMTLTERAFEANAQVVRTQDEMLGVLFDELV